MSTWKCFMCDSAEPCTLMDNVSTDSPTLCPFSDTGLTPSWVSVDGHPYTVIGIWSSTDELFAEHVMALTPEDARKQMNIDDRVVMTVIAGHHQAL